MLKNHKNWYGDKHFIYILTRFPLPFPLYDYNRDKCFFITYTFFVCSVSINTWTVDLRKNWLPVSIYTIYKILDVTKTSIKKYIIDVSINKNGKIIINNKSKIVITLNDVPYLPIYGHQFNNFKSTP